MMAFYKIMSDEKKANYFLIRGKMANSEMARRLGHNEASLRRFLTKYTETGTEEAQAYA